MTDHARESDADTAVAEPQPRESPRADTDAKPDRPPRYAVILHNDDDIDFSFVIATLVKVLKVSATAAMRFALVAHKTGRCAVWTGLKEHAELKAQQIKGAGIDPTATCEHPRPIKATIEPVPGT